jgi:hypothetical protein
MVESWYHLGLEIACQFYPFQMRSFTRQQAKELPEEVVLESNTNKIIHF